MKTRIFTFILTLCLIFSMMPANVFAVSGGGQIEGGISTGDKVDVPENPTEEAPTEEEPTEEPDEFLLAAPVVTASNKAETGKPHLTWEAVAGAVKYFIYRATSENGKYKLMKDTENTYYINTNSTVGKTYYYKVVAMGSEDGVVSDDSNVVSCTCKLPRPVVAASNAEKNGKPMLTWEPLEGAVKYKVYRADTEDGTYKLMLTTENHSYTNTNVELGKTYYYKVRALDAADNAVSEYSDVVSGTYILPRPVVTLSNAVKTGNVALSWKPIEGAKEYKVYRSTEVDGKYSRMYTTVGNTYTNSNADVGVTYYYKVIAIAENEAGNSAYSDIVSGMRTLAQPEVTIGLDAKTGKPKLTWRPVEDAVCYIIYRAQTEQGSYKKMYTAANTTYINTKAEAGVNYFYKVVAVAENPAANSEFSEVVIHEAVTLVQPVVKAANDAATGKIKLTWDAVESAASYQIYRADAKGGSYQLIDAASTTTYTDTAAKVGRTYYYKVQATTQSGAMNSELSEAVGCICTLAQPVVTASNVEKTGKVKLDWEPVAGAVAYEVYRSNTKEGGYKKMYIAYGKTYTNSSAAANNTYYYQVVAVAENTEANSAPSAAKRRTVNCAKPTVSGIADLKTGKPRLTWASVEGAVEYKVYRATSRNGKYSLMYTSTSNTYQNTSAEVGKTYYYKIKAVGSNPDSASFYSDVVSVLAVNSKFQYVYASYDTTKSGSAERNTNLYLACKAINGTILAPGETFSFNEVVGPRTADKGYQSAPIVGGMGRGGGICQVSTTLFNVALYANMGITQRRQHSVAVTYVPMGRDAMIYKTSSDLKFVNTSDYYIKILAESSNGFVKISMVTREEGVSPKSDVSLKVTYSSGTYTLKRYYKGEVNYTCKSKY